MPTGGISTHIILSVKNQDGYVMCFRIKRSSQLKKLMDAYCDRVSAGIDSVAFLFNDCFLRMDHTPYQLGMKADEIDVFDVKSLRLYMSSRPSPDVEKGSRTQSSVETEELSNGKEINIDDYTFDDLEKITTHRFEHAMLFIKASFVKLNRMTEDAQRYIEEVQTQANSREEDFNAKMAEKDLVIEQMRNELQQANDAIPNVFSRVQSILAKELSKVQKHLVTDT